MFLTYSSKRLELPYKYIKMCFSTSNSNFPMLTSTVPGNIKVGLNL